MDLNLNGDSDSSEEDEAIGEGKQVAVKEEKGKPAEKTPEPEKEVEVTQVVKPAPVLSTRYHLLNARVHEDPFDTESWIGMVMEVQSQGPETTCAVYKRFLEQFPTAGRYWKQYAELEMQQQNWSEVEQIFEKSLLVW